MEGPKLSNFKIGESILKKVKIEDSKVQLNLEFNSHQTHMRNVMEADQIK